MYHSNTAASRMTARDSWLPNYYPFKSLFRYIFNISNALSKIPLSCWLYFCWNRFPGIPVALLHYFSIERESALCTCPRFLCTSPISAFSSVWIYHVVFTLLQIQSIIFSKTNKTLQLFPCVSLLVESYCWQNYGCQAFIIQHWIKGSIQQWKKCLSNQ